MGTMIGYMRVSTDDQNDARQEDALRKAGVVKIFSDKQTGQILERPGLNSLKAYAREGDTVVVLSMDRLARNLVEFRKCIDEFKEKGIIIRFLKENITVEGGDSPVTMLFLSMMGAFAEFERAFIKERQREGIILAKARNAYKGGVLKLKPEERDYLYSAADSGVPKTTIAKNLKVQRCTVYSYLKLRENLKALN